MFDLHGTLASVASLRPTGPWLRSRGHQAPAGPAAPAQPSAHDRLIQQLLESVSSFDAATFAPVVGGAADAGRISRRFMGGAARRFQLLTEWEAVRAVPATGWRSGAVWGRPMGLEADGAEPMDPHFLVRPASIANAQDRKARRAMLVQRYVDAMDSLEDSMDASASAGEGATSGRLNSQAYRERAEALMAMRNAEEAALVLDRAFDADAFIEARPPGQDGALRGFLRDVRRDWPA